MGPNFILFLYGSNFILIFLFSWFVVDFAFIFSAHERIQLGFYMWQVFSPIFGASELAQELKGLFVLF